MFCRILLSTRFIISSILLIIFCIVQLVWNKVLIRWTCAPCWIQFHVSSFALFHNIVYICIWLWQTDKKQLKQNRKARSMCQAQCQLARFRWLRNVSTENSQAELNTRRSWLKMQRITMRCVRCARMCKTIVLSSETPFFPGVLASVCAVCVAALAIHTCYACTVQIRNLTLRRSVCCVCWTSVCVCVSHERLWTHWGAGFWTITHPQRAHIHLRI